MCWYWWPSAKFPVQNVLDLRKCNIADEWEDAIFTCEDKLLMANDDCDDDALTMWWPSVRNVLSLRKFLMHSFPMSSPLHTTCTAYLFIMMTMMIMMILPWLNKYQSLQELRNCPNGARDVMESLKILTFPWLVFGGHLMSLDSWSAYNTRLVAVEAMQFDFKSSCRRSNFSWKFTPAGVSVKKLKMSPTMRERSMRREIINGWVLVTGRPLPLSQLENNPPPTFIVGK